MSGPSLLLRLEGVTLAVAALALYIHLGYGWVLLVVLALASDVSLLGYLAGARAGAAAYGLAHTTTLPLALGVAGFIGDTRLPVQLALVWLVHIGADRALGYGLKYGSGFRETHLQRV